MTEEAKLIWPDRPTCHDGDYRASVHRGMRFRMVGEGDSKYSVLEHTESEEALTHWRPQDLTGKGERLDNTLNTYGYPFRTCSFCGSINPEDLFNFLKDPNLNVRLGGSDWKYGWPHKFYVEGIPNPLYGGKVFSGSTSDSKRERLLPLKDGDVIIEQHEVKQEFINGRLVHEYHSMPRFTKLMAMDAPQFSHAKWYNDHLLDIADEATFNAMTALLLVRANIRFYKQDGKLKYDAPSRGYQQATQQETVPGIQ